MSFADDTSLLISDANINTLFVRANAEMHNLYDWFCANHLSLNPKKTKFMVFKAGTRNIDYTNLHITIDGVHLEQIGSQFNEKTTKFLGIYVDDSLTWKNHLIYVNNKIARALYGIKQAKNFLPIDSLKTLYEALIQPYISYGILAWGNASSTMLKKTVTLQKRAVRMINNYGYNSHTEPLFKSSQIFKLNDLYEFRVCLFMHDFVNKELPHSFDNVFRFNFDIQGDHVTRQSSLLNVARCDSAFSRKLPLYNFPVVWNKWNLSLPRYRSKSHMKNIMKRHILNKYAALVTCNNPFCRQCAHV